jgi:hypothetical protein
LSAEARLRAKADATKQSSFRCTSGLLRGVYHRAALCADPLARNDRKHLIRSLMARPNLKNFRRIVVKVGSSLLIDSDAGEVRAAWLAAL